MDSNQLYKLDNDSLSKIVDSLPHLTSEDKRELSLMIASKEADMRMLVCEKVVNSNMSHAEFQQFINGLSDMSKEKMVFAGGVNLKTGTGSMKLDVKGGDNRLIVPVLLIISITVIVLAVLFFSKP